MVACRRRFGPGSFRRFEPGFSVVCRAFCLLPFLLVFSLSGADAGSLPKKDSSKFEYRYEGQSPMMVHAGRVHLGAGYYGPLEGASVRSDGGQATITSPEPGGLFLQNPLWETDADDTGGWTWEIRLKVPATNTRRSFQVRIGDAPASDSHPQIGLQFGPDRIQGFNGTVFVDCDLAEDFVTLRIAQAPGKDDYLIWLDDRAVTVDTSGERLSDVAASWIGDGSSAAGGTTIVDHIRWTGAGAFAPPERGGSARGGEDRDTAGESADRGAASERPTYVPKRRSVPDFGLMLNDDGDVSFPSSDPQTALDYRKAMVDALAGTPLKTLMYSVGMGSDTLYYPTKVANVVGWRKTRYNTLHQQPTSEEQMWAQRLENIVRGMEAGIDPIRVSAERARTHGMYFVPSYRMNDDHFMFDPLEYPLTGQFWLEHHERLKIRRSPILSDPHYGQLLDFSHKQVRDFRLAVLREIIDRYQDVMDGIELDFNRVQVFFPYQKADERAHLMTDLVATIRRQLDEVGKRNDRPYYLFVRVPPTLENCRWAGLDVPAWIKHHLVDVLIPAQLMTLAHDMPVDEFVKLAKPEGVHVSPALYPRTGWSWPFPGDPDVYSYSGRSSRQATPKLFRGAASNYWTMGASGFQLFNFRTTEIPFGDTNYRIMRDLARPACLRLANKVYAITPGYYLDHEDTYQYRKQLPLEANLEELCALNLIVGDDLMEGPAPDRLLLRLGLRDVSGAERLELRLNDQVLHEGAVGDGLVSVGEGEPPTAPTHYLHVNIDDCRMIQRGHNSLRFRFQGTAGMPAVQVTECQLAVYYFPRPNAIFEP